MKMMSYLVVGHIFFDDHFGGGARCFIDSGYAKCPLGYTILWDKSKGEKNETEIRKGKEKASGSRLISQKRKKNDAFQPINGQVAFLIELLTTFINYPACQPSALCIPCIPCTSSHHRQTFPGNLHLYPSNGDYQ
jgi:hypothetical protein